MHIMSGGKMSNRKIIKGEKRRK